MTDKPLDKFLELLYTAKRPIIIAGHGIELADMTKFFRENVNIPTVWSQGGINVLSTDHPLNIGKIGTKGSRAGNFAVQNADLVISIGSRLSVSTTGQEYNSFAREAKVVAVDHDYDEIKKQTIKIHMFLGVGAETFIIWLFGNLKEKPLSIDEWISKCQHWKEIFPVYQKEYSKSDKVNLYQFVETLSQCLQPDDVVVADAGSAMFVTSQGIRFGENNRVILSHAQAEMGFTVPACVGVACAKKGRVIGITGDGSLQMNIQELQTIKHHQFPIKLFVWNNNGYLSMKNTQKMFFGRYTAADPSSGVTFPDLQKIAAAYGIEYMRVVNTETLLTTLQLALDYECPTICEVMCLPEQELLTVKSTVENGKFVSRPLEDMSPFLDRKIFKAEMIIKPLDCSL